MVYKLAYEIPNSTFLHAPLVANLPIKNNNDCDISEVEVNMAIFNGTNDQINPYNGGLVSLLGNDSRGEVLSSEESYKKASYQELVVLLLFISIWLWLCVPKYKISLFLLFFIRD